MGVRQEARRRLPDWLAEPLRGALADLRAAREWRAYRRQPVVPPPHVVKVRTVLGYARRHQLRVLIETGTFEGEMVRKCRRAFREIYTVELEAGYAERGEKETPLLEELDAIRRHEVKDHVILIDDVRCLGEGDYPDMETLTRALRAIRPDYRVEVAADILRCTPPGSGVAR